MKHIKPVSRADIFDDFDDFFRDFELEMRRFFDRFGK